MRHHRNPKTHDHAELADSFRRFGFVAFPTIDETTQVMVAGHGRCETLAMMKAMGQTPPDRVHVHEETGDWWLPVIRGVEFKSDRERDAYVVADNQHVIGGGINRDALRDIMRELAAEEGGTDGLGFDQDELDDLLLDDDDDTAGAGDGSDILNTGPKEIDVEGHTRQIGATPKPSPAHKVRPPIQMTNADWKLHLGDCLEGMRKLDSDSMDAVVTDPPAGISFMGRAWDDDKGGRDQWIDWLRQIMVEAMRVLKPGGHMLAWALPRTSHWTAFAIENAGFEIRDRLSHVFGSGFPKSLDVSKAIDAKLGASAARPVIARRTDGVGNTEDSMHFHEGFAASREQEFDETGPATEQAAQAEGYGTALKPAMEDWWLCRKPLDGTVAENFLKWGTGGLNIDDCRIGYGDQPPPAPVFAGAKGGEDGIYGVSGNYESKVSPIGRWPAHFVMSHSSECTQTDGAYQCADGCPVAILDEQSGIAKATKGGVHSHAGSLGIMNDDGWKPHGVSVVPARPGGGASRFFYVAKPSKSETEAGLDALPERTAGELTGGREEGSDGLKSPRAGSGRGGGRKNIHPTKKSIALMRWMIKLVAPPARDGVAPIILDPFAGSGTTGLAALVEGVRFVGFELDAAHHEIACARLRSIIEDPRQVDDADDEPASSETPATRDASTSDG